MVPMMKFKRTNATDVRCSCHTGKIYTGNVLIERLHVDLWNTFPRYKLQCCHCGNEWHMFATYSRIDDLIDLREFINGVREYGLRPKRQ